MADVHAAQFVEGGEHAGEGLAGAAQPGASAATPGQPTTPIPTVGSGAPRAGVVSPGVGAVAGGGGPQPSGATEQLHGLALGMIAALGSSIPVCDIGSRFESCVLGTLASVIAQSPGKQLGLDYPDADNVHARCLGDASSSFV